MELYKVEWSVLGTKEVERAQCARERSSSQSTSSGPKAERSRPFPFLRHHGGGWIWRTFIVITAAIGLHVANGSTIPYPVEPQPGHPQGGHGGFSGKCCERGQDRVVLSTKTTQPAPQSSSESGEIGRSAEAQKAADGGLSRTSQKTVATGTSTLQERARRHRITIEGCQGVPREAGSRRRCRRDGPLHRHQREQLGRDAWGDCPNGRSRTAAKGEKGQGRSLCYGTSTPNADAVDHATWCSTEWFVRPTEWCDVWDRQWYVWPITKEDFTTSTGECWALQENQGTRSREGRTLFGRGSASGDYGVICTSMSGSHRTVEALENSRLCPSMYSRTIGSGSPERLYCSMIDPSGFGTAITVTTGELQSLRHRCATKAGGCTSMLIHFHKRWGCHENNSIFSASKDMNETERVVNDRLTSGRVYRLGILLHLFMVFNNVITACYTIGVVVIYVIGKVTFLWGDQVTCGLTFEDQTWQWFRVMILAVCTIWKALYPQPRKPVFRVDVGKHHSFRRGVLRSPINGRLVRRTRVFVLLLCNQNVLVAANLAMHGTGVDARQMVRDSDQIGEVRGFYNEAYSQQAGLTDHNYHTHQEQWRTSSVARLEGGGDSPHVFDRWCDCCPCTSVRQPRFLGNEPEQFWQKDAVPRSQFRMPANRNEDTLNVLLQTGQGRQAIEGDHVRDQCTVLGTHEDDDPSTLQLTAVQSRDFEGPIDEVQAGKRWPGREINSASGTPCPDFTLWQCEIDVSSPPFLQLRPNPQLQQPFDEVVPDVRTGPNGPEIVGTITPPPNWQRTAIFRAAVASGACRRGPGGHLVVHIRSWYIAHNGLCIHQPRDFAMRPQLLVRLLHALRRTWSDHLPGHETILARAVRPPPVDSDATRRFHVIAEINRPVQTDLNPILIATREITRGGVSVPTWCTALLPTQMTSVDLYQACRPACGLHQFLIPVGGNLRRWLTPYHARVLSPGLFIPCWYDVRLQPVQHPPYETEEDITDLMQRAITSDTSTPQQTPSTTVSSSGTVLVHTFRMSATHRLVVLDPGAQTTYFQQLVEVWRAPRHDQLIDYHLVATPPHDLTNTGDSVFLLEWTTDRNRQASQSDQIILLDIVLAGDDPTAGPHTTRRVLWIRHTTTRQGVLHLTSSAAICERETIECFVHINHRLWVNDDEMPRQMSHGDYVRVQIRGIHSTPTELQVDLCEQESADQQRYLFHPSPQKSPTSPTVEQGDTESNETGEADGKDRSRSPHGRESGPQEGNSLVQLYVEMKTYITTPYRTTRTLKSNVLLLGCRKFMKSQTVVVLLVLFQMAHTMVNTMMMGRFVHPSVNLHHQEMDHQFSLTPWMTVSHLLDTIWFLTMRLRM